MKTLEAEYTAGGKSFKMSAKDPETISFPLAPGIEPEAEVHYGDNGKLLVEAWQGGRYALKTASGSLLRAQAPALPPPLEISGP